MEWLILQTVVKLLRADAPKILKAMTQCLWDVTEKEEAIILIHCNHYDSQ